MTNTELASLTETTSNLLKALAHPARLHICCALRETEMSVGQIEETLNIKQPRLSRELAKLREEGLLETRRESKVIFYTLTQDVNFRQMIDAICGVMFGQPAELPKTTQSTRAVQPSGCSVFARTADQDLATN